MNTKKKNPLYAFMAYIACAIVFAFSAMTSHAVGLIPFSDKPVIDQAKVLTDEQSQHLSDRVKAFMDETTMEIKLVTIDDVSPYATASTYALDLYRKWKLGDKEKRNGLMMLITQKIGSTSSDMKDYCRIVTGDGIIKILPNDVVINEIKRQLMMPNLPGDPYKAFDSSLDKTFANISIWSKAHPEDNTVRGNVLALAANTAPAEKNPTTEQGGDAAALTTPAADTPKEKTDNNGSVLAVGLVILVLAIIGFIIFKSVSDSSKPASYDPWSNSREHSRPVSTPSPSRDMSSPPARPTAPVRTTASAAAAASGVVYSKKSNPTTPSKSKGSSSSKQTPSRSDCDGGNSNAAAMLFMATDGGGASAAAPAAPAADGGGGGCGGGGCGGGGGGGCGGGGCGS